MNKITLIGIDTAKRVFHLVGVDGRGVVVWRRKLRRGGLLARLAQLERSRVVLEACAASHHWARSIGALGHEVRLIAPQHVTPYRRGQKNDYRDAEAIVSASLAPAMRLPPDSSTATSRDWDGTSRLAWGTPAAPSL